MRGVLEPRGGGSFKASWSQLQVSELCVWEARSHAVLHTVRTLWPDLHLSPEVCTAKSRGGFDTQQVEPDETAHRSLFLTFRNDDPGESAGKFLAASPYPLSSPPKIQVLSSRNFSALQPSGSFLSASRLAILQLLSLLPKAVGGMGEPGVWGPLHSLPSIQ